MKKLLLILLLFSFLMMSCERNNQSDNIDPNYPSIINALDDTQLSQLRTEYFSTYKYMKSSLNNFGFCSNNESYRDVDYPPSSYITSRAEARKLIREFLALNSDITGVSDTSAVNITYMLYGDKLNHWVVKTGLQIIDSLEVVNSEITFTVMNNEIYCCSGNWYTDIYIPSRIIVDQEQSKKNLVGKSVSHLNIGGEVFYQKITDDSFEESTYTLSIFPLNINNSIELRLVWNVYLPMINYYLYVDAMTGELVYSEDVMIS